MKRVAEVRLVLEDLAPQIEVTLGPRLEVALDCAFCQRTDRTVTFKLGKSTGRCSPGSAYQPGVEHPPFPGSLIDRRFERQGRLAIGSYRLEYHTEPFEDQRPRRTWSGLPTWARVYCSMLCPECGQICNAGTQNNLVRPISRRCQCGYLFCVERREMPELRWMDPKTGRWFAQPERFGADEEPAL